MIAAATAVARPLVLHSAVRCVSTAGRALARGARSVGLRLSPRVWTAATIRLPAPRWPV